MRTENNKISTLIESIPYIQKFHGKTFVIKYGGNAMSDKSIAMKVAQDLVLLKLVGINIVIVHGGGPQIDEFLSKLDKPRKFHNGLRVTDNETMDLVEMVLTGRVNKDIVSMLNKAGGYAFGLTGKDASFIKAKKIKSQIKNRKKTDLGRVGEVVKVDPSLLLNLISDKFIPVISPIGVDSKGDSLNINADVVASEIAAVLKCEKLIFMTDTDGVMKKSKLIPNVSIGEISKLIKNQTITGGMIPKIESAKLAIKKNVKSAHIINGTSPHSLLLEVFTEKGVGTAITLK